MHSNALLPDMFEAVVMAFAETLVRSYRERWNRSATEPESKATTQVTTASPWLRVDEAASRAQCGEKMLYREVRAGRLRAVRVGGRRSLRFRAEWIDAWLESQAPFEMTPDASRTKRGGRSG
jgi:excisionase family DNA binding protein